MPIRMGAKPDTYKVIPLFEKEDRLEVIDLGKVEFTIVGAIEDCLIIRLPRDGMQPWKIRKVMKRVQLGIQKQIICIGEDVEFLRVERI